MSKKKKIVMIVVIVLTVFIGYKTVATMIPIRTTGSQIGGTNIYYKDRIHLFSLCDSILEVDVYENDDYVYQYKMVHLGSGCVSDLYVFDGMTPVKLKEAIDNNIIDLDEFLQSDVVIKQDKSEENTE